MISKRVAENVLFKVRKYIPEKARRRNLLYSLSQIAGSKSFSDTMELIHKMNREADKEEEQASRKEIQI